MQKIDDIQRASIRRSEAYLRKKAMQQPTGYIREFIAGVLFAALTIICFIIALAL